MSQLTYGKLELTEEDFKTKYTPEKCWEAIDRLSELLNNPGYLQSELKVDAQFGAEFLAKTKELLHLLVDEYDFSVAPTDDKVVARMADLYRDLDRIQASHLMREISVASEYMQMIPFRDILESLEEDISEFTDKMSAEELDNFKAAKEAAGEVGKNVAAAKINPRIAPILTAGVRAAGGQAEFAKLQIEACAELPDEYQANPSLVMATQLSGAIMKAIVRRFSSPEYANMQTRGVIESVIAAKQAVSMNFFCFWEGRPADLFSSLQKSAERALMTCLSDVKGEANPVPEAEEVKVKEDSTVFPSNGTVN